MRRLARFLLVDDDPDTQTLVRHIFQRHGLENPLEDASSGLEALARLRDTAAPMVDVVLLDQGLPDISGLEVAEALAAEPRLAHLVVLMISGHGAAALGANPPANIKAALQKPLQLASLLRNLQQHAGMTAAIHVEAASAE